MRSRISGGHPSSNPMIRATDLARVRQRLEEERARRLALAERPRFCVVNHARVEQALSRR